MQLQSGQIENAWAECKCGLTGVHFDSVGSRASALCLGPRPLGYTAILARCRNPPILVQHMQPAFRLYAHQSTGTGTGGMRPRRGESGKWESQGGRNRTMKVHTGRAATTLWLYRYRKGGGVVGHLPRRQPARGRVRGCRERQSSTWPTTESSWRQWTFDFAQSKWRAMASTVTQDSSAPDCDREGTSLASL